MTISARLSTKPLPASSTRDLGPTRTQRCENIRRRRFPCENCRT
jgi:hypothetical protein